MARTKAQVSMIEYAGTQIDARAHKNYIINAGMRVSQQNGTSSGTASGYYPVDQFSVIHSQDGTLTSAQVASATAGGSPTRLRVTVTTQDGTIAAGQYAHIYHPIEGLRCSDLRFGGSSAKQVVLRFGWKSPAGTFAVCLSNQDDNRTYVREFTISGGDANTDTVQTVTFPGDTSGTWYTDNTLAMQLRWTLATGATFQTTANAWQAGEYYGTASTSNGIGTGSDVFELFDVGMHADIDELGVAPPFVLPSYDDELRACQRYYVQFRNPLTYNGALSGSTLHYETIELPVDLRVAPSLSVVSQFQYFNSGTVTNFTPAFSFFDPRGVAIYGSGLTNVTGFTGAGIGAASARM